MSEKRAVCLNCIDGRAQIPVIEAIKENFGVAHVDMITEPGMDGLLADLKRPIEEIKQKVHLSIEKNNATVVVVAGHYDCKGNPVDEATHRAHVKAARERLQKEFPGSDVQGLWVNADWNGEIV